MRKLISYGCDYCSYVSEDPQAVAKHMAVWHKTDPGKRKYEAVLSLGSDDDFGAFGALWDNYENCYEVSGIFDTKWGATRFLRGHLKLLRKNAHGQCKNHGCRCDDPHCVEIRQYIEGFLTTLDWYEDPQSSPTQGAINYEEHGFLAHTFNYEAFNRGELNVKYGGNSEGTMTITFEEVVT